MHNLSYLLHIGTCQERDIVYVYYRMQYTVCPAHRAHESDLLSHNTTAALKPVARTVPVLYSTREDL